MRKNLRVRSEAVRNLTVTERAAIIGGADIEPACSLRAKDSCWPDPPPRIYQTYRCSEKLCGGGL